MLPLSVNLCHFSYKITTWAVKEDRPALVLVRSKWVVISDAVAIGKRGNNEGEELWDEPVNCNKTVGETKKNGVKATDQLLWFLPSSGEITAKMKKWWVKQHKRESVRKWRFGREKDKNVLRNKMEREWRQKREMCEGAQCVNVMPN